MKTRPPTLPAPHPAPSDIAVLREILRQPTAPFHEEAPARCIERLARDWGLCADRTRSGNVCVRTGGPRGAAPAWVFVAHMDHPGFESLARRGRTIEAIMRGGGPDRGRVTFDAPDGPVGGEVIAADTEAVYGVRRVRVRLERAADVPPGVMGRWDLPAWRRTGRLVEARACDDLVGAAAVLCALRRMAQADAGVRVMGLFTRAEECGFIGASAACRDRTIPRGANVISVESSASRPGTQPGDGVILRVGDRTWTFDADLTAFIGGVAERLRRTERGFRYVRALMPGGTCEATVFCVEGFRTAALCVPMDGYHNGQEGGGTAEPERIHLDDFRRLVRLLAELPLADGGAVETRRALRRALRDRYARWGSLLRPGTRSGGGSAR